jgi:hypothetical protein
LYERISVCGKCAALRKNALIGKDEVHQAHLTDFMTLADLPLPIRR